MNAEPFALKLNIDSKVIDGLTITLLLELVQIDRRPP
jgi:hypothetical protein